MLSKSAVKYIQSLSQKKFRSSEGFFVIEGPKIMQEALQTPTVKIAKIYALHEWIVANETSVKAGTDVIAVTEEQLHRISQHPAPNQVVAVIQMPVAASSGARANEISLVLDGIQDPGNLGTIIRTSDWFGVNQVICSEDCADIYNHKVIQAAMGSLFRVEVAYENLSNWFQTCKPVKVYGAMLNGKPLSAVEKIKNGYVVIGSEGRGISEAIMPFIHERITIEKFGAAESLNEAIATGIILSHLRI